MIKMTLSELFERWGSLPTELSWVCLDPKDLVPESFVIVFNGDQLESDEDYPGPVRLGMTFDVGMWEVEDIVANARRQGLEPTLQEFVEGLAYYAVHDAFRKWR